MSDKNIKLGTDSVRWDLSQLYTALDDPKLMADADWLANELQKFQTLYHGQLQTQLGAALRALAELEKRSSKIFVYLHLVKSLDVQNEAVIRKQAELEVKLQPLMATNLAFFDIEVATLSEADIQAQAASDTFVKQHLPLIRNIRRFQPHQLSEPVEAAIGKRAMFSASSWSTYFNEIEAALRFSLEGKELGLEELLHVISTDKDATKRAAAMQVLNDGLEKNLTQLSAFALFQVTGLKSLDDQDRKYPHPLSYQNLVNQVPDETVEALHQATNTVGAQLAQRYYSLKAKILGQPVLQWSDRNAPLPFSDETQIPYEEGRRLVVDAYQQFSPTLAGIVQELMTARRIDAHVTPNRESGAYNYSGVFPNDEVISFTFMNYLGSRRDVMTLAHELGHAVHGILAGRAQGVLQSHPPTAYCETASIFGEMMTFNFLLAKTESFEEKMSLLCSKIEDMMNSVVRQISFSNFERRIHGDGQRRSATELDAIWMEETAKMYGPSGKVFAYEHMNHLWAYISHFHRPFYVYGYAFGELLTQSLFAKQESVGKQFEPLYLELLKAGATKDAATLLAPFGLDPAKPEFWAAGIQNSFGRLIEEAETLWATRSGK